MLESILAAKVGSTRRAEHYFDPRLVIANYRRASAEE